MFTVCVLQRKVFHVLVCAYACVCVQGWLCGCMCWQGMFLSVICTGQDVLFVPAVELSCRLIPAVIFTVCDM